MSRFAVLAHDWPMPHFDLLLENEGTLKAWRLAVEPRGDSPITAIPNFDHRMLYLDYEGPLSGDRGSVTSWDGGSLNWIETGDDRVVVELHGAKLIGRYELKRIGENWRFHRTTS